MLSRTTRSIRRNDVKSQKSLVFGAKKLTIYHQATLGDTGINLTSLVFPTGLVGKTNPTLSDIAAASIYQFQDNVLVISSVAGILQQGLSFTIASSTRINFIGFTARANEVFTIIIDAVVKSGNLVVDGRAIASTGLLAQNATDYNVGDTFEIAKYPSAQLGSVLVFRNGVLQYRNTANATAAQTADGDYQEVPVAGGFGSLIRFNQPAQNASGDNISVVSNGVLIERPNVSLMSTIETQQGQIDKLVSVLADTAGVPTTTFQSNPNNVQLRQFGDRIIQDEANLAALQATLGTYLSATHGAYSTTAGALSTWYIPDPTFTIQLQPGTWLVGGHAAVYGQPDAGGATLFGALGTSSTPGVGIISQVLAAVVLSTGNADIGGNAALSGVVTVTVPTNIYFNIMGAAFSGSPTTLGPSGFGLRDNLGPGNLGLLWAHRIK